MAQVCDMNDANFDPNALDRLAEGMKNNFSE